MNDRPEDQKPPEDPKPEDQKPPESDLDRLRAAKDAEIAEANRQNQELQARIAGIERQISATATTTQAVEDIKKFLNDLDRTDPEHALDVLERRLIATGEELGKEKSTTAFLGSQYKTALANYHAEAIAREHGGDPKTYRAELMKSATEESMTENAKILAGRVGLDNERKRNGGGGNRPNGNGANGANYQVDEGRGGPVRTSVLNDMDAIDVTTPEGQAEWNKRESEFSRRIRTGA